VAPVFRAPEALMVVTDQLIARFAAGVDEEELTRLCDQFGLDLRDQASWTPSTYLMGSRDGDALGAANALHQQPEVVWAQPDFLRLVDRPYLSPPGHGPLGVHLGILESSSDTPISKGSNHFLVSEPAIFDSRIDFQGREALKMESPGR